MLGTFCYLRYPINKCAAILDPLLLIELYFDFIMKDILPIPMQCKLKNESVSSYALHARAGTNHILISIFR